MRKLKKKNQTDLDISLEKIFEEDLDTFSPDFGFFGIPSHVYDKDTAEMEVCNGCNGKGEYTLLFTIKECDECSGTGMTTN